LIFILFIAAVVLCFRGFVLDRITVDGASMQGTFYDGDVLWVQKFDVENLNRFDVVIANAYHRTVIKRVIGLPSETVTIKDGKVYINGTILDGDYGDYIKDGGLAISGYKLSDNEYFILGDNRNESADSRIFGAVKISNIRGKVLYQIFPFTRFGLVAHGEQIEK
jgi:signal peptidase I